MNKKDVKNAVEAFISKHSAPPALRVEWPQLGFEIKGISEVKINEEPSEECKNPWTFKGTADIVKMSERSAELIISSYEIVGSAKFVCHSNPTDDRLIPDVKEITITKATPITKK